MSEQQSEQEPEAEPNAGTPEAIADRLIQRERALNAERQSPAPAEPEKPKHFWSRSTKAVAAIALGGGLALGGLEQASEPSQEVVSSQYLHEAGSFVPEDFDVIE